MLPSPSLGAPLLSGSASPPFCWGIPLVALAAGAGGGAGWLTGLGAGAGAGGAAGWLTGLRAGAGAGAAAGWFTGWGAGAGAAGWLTGLRAAACALRAGLGAGVRATAGFVRLGADAAGTGRAVAALWPAAWPEPPPLELSTTTSAAIPTTASASNPASGFRERRLVSAPCVMTLTGFHRRRWARRCYLCRGLPRCVAGCQRGGAGGGACGGGGESGDVGSSPRLRQWRRQVSAPTAVRRQLLAPRCGSSIGSRDGPFVFRESKAH